MPDLDPRIAAALSALAAALVAGKGEGASLKPLAHQLAAVKIRSRPEFFASARVRVLPAWVSVLRRFPG